MTRLSNQSLSVLADKLMRRGDKTPTLISLDFEDIEALVNEVRTSRMLPASGEVPGVLVEVAAYLLDRADQYATESPCWIALADAAEAVVRGEAQVAAEHGEFDEDLLRRVEAMRARKHGRSQ